MSIHLVLYHFLLFLIHASHVRCSHCMGLLAALDFPFTPVHISNWTSFRLWFSRVTTYSVTCTCSFLFPSSSLSAFETKGLIFQHCISIHFGSFLHRVFSVDIQEWFTITFSCAEPTSWLSSISPMSLIIKVFYW